MLETAPVNPSSDSGDAAELAQAQQALQSLTYAISHDLRAPLRAIAGFSQALQEHATGKLDATGQHFLKRIEESTQRLSAMIDGLLTISRLMQAEVHMSSVDLSMMCRSLLDELQQQPDNQNAHRLQVSIQAGMHALCDQHLIRIALQAVLHNAWKFTRPVHNEIGSACIDVSASIHHDNIILKIHDNGIGIDARYAERLFVPFQHLQSRADLNGLGLGLVSAARIIQRHGGRIWLDISPESRPVPGTTFCISLRHA